jgi:hypothetical protein
MLTAHPASASGVPTTPVPDCPFNIEFTGWSRVEAILDFGPQPSELLAAVLLMQDRGDDGGLAAAIPALEYLRSNELFEGGGESYVSDWHRHPSIEDTTRMSFGGDALTEGVETHRIEGETVRVHNVAKTIADTFKYRNKIGLDVAVEALREAWRARRFTMDKMFRYARVCRVERVMRPYLEALVA